MFYCHIHKVIRVCTKYCSPIFLIKFLLSTLYNRVHHHTVRFFPKRYARISVTFLGFIGFEQVTGNNRFRPWNVPDLRNLVDLSYSLKSFPIKIFFIAFDIFYLLNYCFSLNTGSKAIFSKKSKNLYDNSLFGWL